MREAGRWAALLFFLETGPYGTAREGGPRRGPRALRTPSAEAVNTAKHCRQQRAHPCWHVSIAEDAGHSDRRMQGTVAPTVNGTCFPQEPASPRIGLRRTTRRGCPAPDARLPLETCRVAFGLWSSSVCGENASLPLNRLEGFAEAAEGCRGAVLSRQRDLQHRGATFAELNRAPRSRCVNTKESLGLRNCHLKMFEKAKSSGQQLSVLRRVA